MPYPDSYRPWFGGSSEPGAASIAFLEKLLSYVISPSLVAGVIVEPILSMGNIVPPDGYFEALAEICERNQIPLIADEVMTGIGRTGRMFAMENWNLWPTVICLGKALSCSLPFSMLLAEDDLAEKWEPKDYASMSKDGDILGCAVALETLRVVREEKLVDRAGKTGAYLVKRLQDLKKDCQLLGQIRGLGLMVAFDLVESEQTKKEDSNLAMKIFDRALKHGLILGLRGAKGNVLEFMPALTIDNDQIDTAIEILEQVSKELR
jgi:4-aminobutyrate aminotransferase